MEFWQKAFLIGFTAVSLIGLVRSLYECKKKKNPYGVTYFYRLFGAFVWADLVVFSAFWILASLISYVLHSWVLFLLFIAMFWVVRSVGETQYWFHQQFSTIQRNPPEKFWFHKIFHNDSVWFVYQIFWQCVTVISVILSLYLIKLWLF